MMSMMSETRNPLFQPHSPGLRVRSLAAAALLPGLA